MWKYAPSLILAIILSCAIHWPLNYFTSFGEWNWLTRVFSVAVVVSILLNIIERYTPWYWLTGRSGNDQGV